MQPLDTFLEQFIDINCDDNNSGLKTSNSFLSLSEIVNYNASSNLSETILQPELVEHNSPNQDNNASAQIISSNENTAMTNNSSNDSSLNDLSSIVQFNLVSKLFPLFESLFKGLQCSVSSTNQLDAPQNYATIQTQPTATIHHQVCQPQQVIFHTSQNPSIFTQFETNFSQSIDSCFQPVATFVNNSTTSTCPFQNSFPAQNYSNSTQFNYSNQLANNYVTNCESSTTSSYSSSNSSPLLNNNSFQSSKTCNSVKIQKPQKTKKNVNKKKHKIVLCNNEYEEKMFKLRNPNQTYYKFVER